MKSKALVSSQTVSDDNISVNIRHDLKSKAGPRFGPNNRACPTICSHALPSAFRSKKLPKREFCVQKIRSLGFCFLSKEMLEKVVIFRENVNVFFRGHFGSILRRWEQNVEGQKKWFLENSEIKSLQSQASQLTLKAPTVQKVFCSKSSVLKM